MMRNRHPFTRALQACVTVGRFTEDNGRSLKRDFIKSYTDITIRDGRAVADADAILFATNLEAFAAKFAAPPPCDGGAA